MEEPDDSTELFTKNHNELLSIAKIAEILSWIIIGFALIMICTHISRYQIQVYGSVFDFLADIGVEIISLVLFYGILPFLFLQGLSLGLRMVVETDLNYRMKKNGDQND